MKLVALILICFSALSLDLLSQSSDVDAHHDVTVLSPHVHTTLASLSVESVDGEIHPELIPDTTAYRLYFVSICEAPDASDKDKKRQLALLSAVGLKDDDLRWAAGILETFKEKYDSLVSQYNDSAEAAEKQGGAPDFDSFEFQRDNLVKVTRENFEALLSKDAMDALDRHIKTEKRHMKIGVREAQQ